MEKCKICGKETTIMQVGVRYCTKCGDSVIPVCQPCGVHPFYCKSCKPRKGWQEDKDPDCIGKDGEPKARRHRDAKLRAEAKHAQNKPMKKTKSSKSTILKKTHKFLDTVEDDSGELNMGGGYILKYESWHDACVMDLIESGELSEDEAEDTGNVCDYIEGESQNIIKKEWIPEMRKNYFMFVDGGYHNSGENIYGVTWAIFKKESSRDELYHITFKSKSSKLKKEGILLKRTHTYKGMFGRKLKDLGTIYAFTNFDDAVRWASKMQFDFKKPTIVVAFRGNISDWEQDTHWQSAGAKGKWLKKRGAVLPEDIIEIVLLTQEMTRAVVQTGFKDKELTRLQGVVERG